MSANHPAAFALRFLFLKRRCAVRALRSLDVDLAHAVGALLGGGSRRLLRLLRLLGKGIDSLDKEEDDECHDDEIDDGADEVAVADDSRSRLLSLSQRAVFVAVKGDEPIREVDTLGGERDYRHKDVVDQRLD